MSVISTWSFWTFDNTSGVGKGEVGKGAVKSNKADESKI